MELEELDECIKSFLAVEKEPVVVVIVEAHKKTKEVCRLVVCGVIDIWLEQEGKLFLKGRGAGPKTLKNSVMLYAPIFWDEVVSINILNEQDLLDNTKLLYSMREKLKEETL
jgi:hypothetical protein